MTKFDELDQDLQERVKIRLAQDASIVIKQGARLIKLFDQLYTHGVEKKGSAVDFRRDAFPGEVLLFLLAANNFIKRLAVESSPETFILSDIELNDVRVVRNIWEHQADYILSGEDSFSRLRQENLDWINTKFGAERHRVFTISSHPGLYSISEYIDPLRIIKEAREWFDLVF